MTRQRSSATLTDAESLASTIITETSLRLSARLRTYGRLDEVPISVTVMVPLSFAFSLYEIAAFYGVSVDYLLGNADSKEKQPDSQNENQAVKDELIAFYGDVKDDLTPDDIDDLMVAMRAKAERNKKKKSGV